MYIAFAIVMFIIFAIFGIAILGAASADSSGVGFGLAALLFYVGLLILMLFLFARLGTTGPIMAAKRSFNPFTAIIESWKMTQNNSLMLMLYIFLFTIGFFVAYFILAFVAGLLALASTALAILVGVAAFLPLTMIYALLPAGIYQTLNVSDAEVETVFS